MSHDISELEQGVQDRGKAKEALRLAAKTRKGAARKRVQALSAYIHSNWDGIQATLDGPTLGTIEGHN